MYPNKRVSYFDIAAGSAREGVNAIDSLSERGAFTRKNPLQKPLA
jgi:hypothetical protein